MPHTRLHEGATHLPVGLPLAPVASGSALSSLGTGWGGVPQGYSSGEPQASLASGAQGHQLGH